MKKNSFLNKINKKEKGRYKYSEKKINKLRISIFKSNKNIYIQLIDDLINRTLIGISSHNFINENINGKETKGEIAKKIGKKFGETILNSSSIKELIDKKGIYFNKFSRKYKNTYKGRIKLAIEEIRKVGIYI